jgi:uncharacterized repeat protein (TIGR03803 family)
MTETLQPSTSKIRLGAASAALTLAVVFVFGLVTVRSAHAQTFTDLYNFTIGHDGGNPYAGLIRDSKGNLYGTTYWGGSSGWGTVFKVDKTGKETVLYNFTGRADGANPAAGVIRDSKGNLYGTTYDGGAFNWGVVFKVDTAGTQSVLYSFTGGVGDGCTPDQGLVQDKAGNFYGTTQQCGATGHGVVFQVTPAGTETVLHHFAGGSSDGAYPVGGSLLIDSKINLYGIAEEGGASGEGVVYKLSKSGTLTVLYNFAGGTTDGCFPFGSLAKDKSGNFYGTTQQCGSSGNGVVWKLSKGTETLLHSFAGGTTDGITPYAGVVLDATGNLYGDTSGGGVSGAGTVYKLSSTGTLTLLHSFAGADGQSPYGGVILDTKGKVYGTSEAGGTGGGGTVWSLTP